MRRLRLAVSWRRRRRHNSMEPGWVSGLCLWRVLFAPGRRFAAKVCVLVGPCVLYRGGMFRMTRRLVLKMHMGAHSVYLCCPERVGSAFRVAFGGGFSLRIALFEVRHSQK